MEQVTTAGAGAAVVGPWWITPLHSFNPAMATLLQVLGAAWLIMQMYYKWKEKRERNK